MCTAYLSPTLEPASEACQGLCSSQLGFSWMYSLQLCWILRGLLPTPLLSGFLFLKTFQLPLVLENGPV